MRAVTTARPATAQAVYEPPIGDAPLDDIEQALVRALVPLIVAAIRQDAEQKDHDGE